jgi:hypothetical protein
MIGPRERGGERETAADATLVLNAIALLLDSPDLTEEQRRRLEEIRRRVETREPRLQGRS